MIYTIRFIAALAALATLVFMVIVADHSSLHLVALSFVFGVYVNVPYIAAWIFANKLRSEPIGLIILGIVLTASAITCLYIYYDVFFGDHKKDAQDALVFAVLPFYQAGAIVGAFLAAKLASRFVR